jgi:hypothetical protein
MNIENEREITRPLRQICPCGYVGRRGQGKPLRRCRPWDADICMDTTVRGRRERPGAFDPTALPGSVREGERDHIPTMQATDKGTQRRTVSLWPTRIFPVTKPTDWTHCPTWSLLALSRCSGAKWRADIRWWVPGLVEDGAATSRNSKSGLVRPCTRKYRTTEGTLALLWLSSIDGKCGDACTGHALSASSPTEAMYLRWQSPTKHLYVQICSMSCSVGIWRCRHSLRSETLSVKKQIAVNTWILPPLAAFGLCRQLSAWLCESK